MAAATLRILLGDLVVEPLAAHFWPAIKAPAEAMRIAGNFKAALVALLFVWTFAAFGEEIGYRGFLQNRFSRLLGDSRWAQWAAMFLASVLFGFGHFYKGPAGILDSGIAGAILGTVYLLSARNIWVCILAHGFIDTIGIIFIYFGWAN